MNTSDATLERPVRVQPFEPRGAARAAELQKTPAVCRGNLSLYVVPHVSEDRRASIAKAAYFNSERRGFTPGHEIEDWLAAENEVEQRLAGEGRAF
jgi:hypothetical protein